jgi:hypothetical protein
VERPVSGSLNTTSAPAVGCDTADGADGADGADAMGLLQPTSPLATKSSAVQTRDSFVILEACVRIVMPVPS